MVEGRMRRLLIAAFLLVALSSPARAGWEEGLTAYKDRDYSTALREWLPLAEGGDVRAQNKLGLMYRNGWGVPQDNTEAVKWYRRAAEKGDASAQYSLGSMYEDGRGVPQSFGSAVEWYLKAAEQNEIRAQFDLGAMYAEGQSVPQNFVQALNWFRKAAEQGSTDAQNNLGFMYSSGYGVPRDYSEAVKWYGLAAERGSAYAQLNLGIMYAEGWGVPQDLREAEKWYGKAGLRRRVFTTGEVFGMRGLLRTQAAMWYLTPDHQGDRAAQLNLGFMYEHGYGAPQDDRDAERWYRKAAEQNATFAQFKLGVMYDEGRGVPQDYVEAVKWYRKAAEQGVASAELHLGIMYEEGRGVAQDYLQAHMWYNLATSQFEPGPERDAAAKAREDVAYKMAPAKVALAQQMARNWYPKPQQPDALATAPQPPPGYELVEPTPQQASHAQVAEAQAALAALAYDPGPADGVLGSRTRAAIRAYQAAVGLPVDGEVSDALLASLRTALAHAGTAVPQPQAKGPELYATGSGFVVSQAGQILTNLHVVGDCALVRTGHSDADRQKAAIAAVDSENDLALLLSPPGIRAVATFRKGSGVRPGDSVVAVGFPLQGLLASSTNATTGTVSAVAGIRDDARYLQITAPIQPGNSGGPLLDMSGNVVGVVVSKLDALKVAEATGDIPQNVNFAIKDSVARAFLDAKGVEYETASSDQELTAAEVGERATGFTVLVECWR
jgi:TPR repeat protein